MKDVQSASKALKPRSEILNSDAPCAFRLSCPVTPVRFTLTLPEDPRYCAVVTPSKKQRTKSRMPRLPHGGGAVS